MGEPLQGRLGPVPTGLYSHDQPRPSDNANFDNADQMGTTTTLPTPGPTAATPTSIPRTGLNNDNLKTTTRHHQRPTTTTINIARKDDTSTTATPRQRQHQQIDNDDDRPQQQHVDNDDDDTSTAATTTRRQPQHQHDDSRQPQHHHINNHNDGRNNNASTTTVHDDDTRQLRSHFELSTDPSLRAHTQATHSPAPVSGHASHVTASPPALCPPAATLWTSPLRRHELNTPDSDAATSIPPPTFTLPSQHPPPTAPTHVPSLPQPPPPPLPTTTHTSNLTTSTARKYRNPPLPPQLPPSPPLPPTTHASNTSAALT
ncbi:hypothetical protein EDB85DRAFT_2215727 [Lactarius pseudohatsudake]|nr:hypothetical protein EDB85DRAFT_2215727 [Lactarius pseudohatsudake]